MNIIKKNNGKIEKTAQIRIDRTSITIYNNIACVRMFLFLALTGRKNREIPGTADQQPFNL
jgi:hypothetical protein